LSWNFRLFRLLDFSSELTRGQAMLKVTMIFMGTAAMLMTAVSVPSQAASRQQCRDYAYEQAYRSGSNGKKVFRGALGGAVIGGAAGAILGKGRGRNIGKGALLGGVAGTVLGATRERGEYVDQAAYEQAYADCIESSYNDGGDRRYERRQDRRRIRSEVEYCSARYRSYDPSTGTYLSYSGEYLSCP
jgi:outer membrane lipoprotein SlyB